MTPTPRDLKFNKRNRECDVLQLLGGDVELVGVDDAAVDVGGEAASALFFEAVVSLVNLSSAGYSRGCPSYTL